MALAFLGMQVLPLIYVFTSWLGFANYRLPIWAGIVGAVLFAFAVWLLWRSHVDLGRNWSPGLELRENHALVTDGVYRHIGHPMYASHLLWAVAQGLLLQNWIAGWIFLVVGTALYVLRVRREEQMMLGQFGEAYREYMRRTGRLVPRVGGYTHA